MASRLDELTEDLKEFERLLAEATRSTTRKTLADKVKRIQHEIENLKRSDESTALPRLRRRGGRANEVPTVNVETHEWDQDDEYVTLRLEIPDVVSDHASDAQFIVRQKSVEFRMKDIAGKNYDFILRGFLHEISSRGSEFKVEQGRVSIRLKKKYDGLTWDCLTRAESQKDKSGDTLDKRMDSVWEGFASTNNESNLNETGAEPTGAENEDVREKSEDNEAPRYALRSSPRKRKWKQSKPRRDSSSDESTITKPLMWRKIMRSNDPIVRLCRQFVSKRIGQYENASNRAPTTIICKICNKPISFVQKTDCLTTFTLKRHAITHLTAPNDKLYGCTLCDERKNSHRDLRMHLLLQHRDTATSRNWEKYFQDDTGLEKNQQLIMGVIRQCYDGQEPTGDEGHSNDHQYEGEKATQDDQEDLPAKTPDSDPIRDYCMVLRREKQQNGTLKCQLCKNTSINVTDFNTDSTVTLRMKTHAFLHAGKHYYKCRLCHFTAVTSTLMIRHINASHGRTKEGAGDKFDDYSSLPENRMDILKALERCFDEMDETTNAAATVQRIVDDNPAPAYVYLLPNGDLVIPDSGSDRNLNDSRFHAFSSVSTIPPGCILTLENPNGIEELTVLLQ